MATFRVAETVWQHVPVVTALQGTIKLPPLQPIRENGVAKGHHVLAAKESSAADGPIIRAGALTALGSVLVSCWQPVQSRERRFA